tara:strand:+ start:203 stop:451 length:249 start_codon:yes stop_codon:yes gene_type:complete
MHDQEYLRTMFYETILERSVKQSGYTFNEYYPKASTFSIFNNKDTMNNYMNEFSSQYSNNASHLLEGKKYYLAWTHKERKNG